MTLFPKSACSMIWQLPVESLKCSTTMVLSSGRIPVASNCRSKNPDVFSQAARSSPRLSSSSMSLPLRSAADRVLMTFPKARLVPRLRPLISPFQKGSLAPSALVWVTTTVSLSWCTIFHAKAPSRNLSPSWDS